MALPEYGMLRGQRVPLANAEQKYSQVDLEQIEVEQPDGSIVRPFRFVSDGTTVQKRDGILVVL